MPLILGTNSIKDTGYDVANSLRFNDGSSDYLSQTFSTPTNNKKYTFSSWIKRGSNLGSRTTIFGAGSDGSNENYIGFNSDNTFYYYNNVSAQYRYVSSGVYRDVSAWYHCVVAVDTTLADADDRVILYINGERVAIGTQESIPQNFDTRINSAVNHGVGYAGNTSFPYYWDGYQAETVFIDGQQLDPTSFGEFDEDSPTIWKPIDVSGLTFGTNGFYLDFENSGSLGADVSGNGNNFTVNNLTSIDQSTDTCTNNFATGNPLIKNKTYNDGSLAEGNTYFAPNGRAITCSTIGVTQGKWYAEFKAQDAGALSIGVGDLQLGIQANGQTNPIYYDNNPSYAIGYYNSNGNIQYNTASTSYGNSYADNDIIGVALDMDNYALYFSKNGVFQNSGDPTSGSSKTGDATSTASYNPLNSGEPMFFFVEDFSAAGVGECFLNFGNPAFSISSGNSDGNGYGNFEYSVPSGYYSLNSKNLAEFG